MTSSAEEDMFFSNFARHLLVRKKSDDICEDPKAQLTEDGTDDDRPLEESAESSGSDSDWAKSEEQRKKAEHSADPMHTPRLSAEDKQKGKAVADVHVDDLEGSNEENRPEDGDEDTYKAGRLSKEAISAVHDFGKRVKAEATKIGKQFGKHWQVILTEAGLARKATRKEFIWNQHQAWFKTVLHPSKAVSLQAWKAKQAEHYYAHLHKDPKNAALWKQIREHFDHAVATPDNLSSCESCSLMMEVCEMFAKSALYWHCTHRIHVAGIVIYPGDEESGHQASGFFAGPGIVKALIDAQKVDAKHVIDEITMILKYKDLEAAQAEGKSISFLLPPAAVPNGSLLCNGKSDRDRNRMVAPVIISEAFADVGQALKTSNSRWMTMLDVLYLTRLCIYDWPTGVPPPGPDFDLKSLSASQLHALVGPYLRKHLEKARMIKWKGKSKKSNENRRTKGAFVEEPDVVLTIREWSPLQMQDLTSYLDSEKFVKDLPPHVTCKQLATTIHEEYPNPDAKLCTRTSRFHVHMELRLHAPTQWLHALTLQLCAHTMGLHAQNKELHCKDTTMLDTIQTEPVETSGMPLVSLRLDEKSTDEPGRCSGHANAGTGGRNAQLEKISTLLEALSWVHRPKGSTSLDSTVPVNPRAPEPPCGKGRGRHPKVAPPPYTSSATTNVPNTSCADVGTVEPLQPLNLLFHQAGGRFVFTTHATAVPPDPGLNTVGRKVVGKQSRKIVTGPSVANSVAPPTGFLDQNICDVHAQGIVDSDDEDDNNDNNDDDDNNEEQEEEEEEEMSHWQFGWGEVGGHHTEHPGNVFATLLRVQRQTTRIRFSGQELPLQPQVTCPLTPDFEFQYSRDEDDAVAQTSVSHAVNPSMSSIQWSNSSQIPLDTLHMQPQPQEVQIMMLQPDDVLKCHHKKNGRPRLPDPETLKLLHQVKSNEDQPTQRPKPTQLAWYGPQWKCFLEDAKGECCVQHALENPFPALVADLPLSVSEVLVSVLVTWDQDGKQFEAEIWPQQKSNMARLLYDDLATWRSDLKKSAMSLAPQSYSLIPPPSVPIPERAEW
ncbi:uncharacterized protein F5891DRAFT_1189553 [Suillus fuscotomentosus]|uniref:Uncharacterized protein n=1 Tax=Suillus fuscotomentosus TaxID=1912939 RepID=A0AAD4HKA9_9AGAM|nr:uncharacterized protein F5891DRAFT_1189553 [Suillus fuscotomentosus]KAG1899743.1 hypothetical protein F5891DRAFT_1189553 [Suillus fuscotomentosus]